MAFGSRFRSHTKSSLAKAKVAQEPIPKGKISEVTLFEEGLIKAAKSWWSEDFPSPRSPSERLWGAGTASSSTTPEKKLWKKCKSMFKERSSTNSIRFSLQISDNEKLYNQSTIGRGSGSGSVVHDGEIVESPNMKRFSAHKRFQMEKLPAQMLHVETQRHSWGSTQFNGIEEKLGLLGECSPVSVLDHAVDGNSNVSRTPKSSFASSDFEYNSCHDMSVKSEDDGSLLDEGSIANHYDNVSQELADQVGGSEKDLEYIHHLLNISGFFNAHATQKWHSLMLPINPTLFERLELEIEVGTTFGIESFERVNNSERSERKLLFDSVNNALAEILFPYRELPPWVQRQTLRVAPVPHGRELMEQVWDTIQSWPVPGSDDPYVVLDEIARQDMASTIDNWTELGEEKADVVFQLEELLMADIIKGVIDDFTASELRTERKSRRHSV